MYQYSLDAKSKRGGIQYQLTSGPPGMKMSSKGEITWKVPEDFERDEETVVCELGLTGEDSEYELRVPARWNPTGASIERFDDALTAFQRHAMIERLLLDDGWALQTFESERVTVH